MLVNYALPKFNFNQQPVHNQSKGMFTGYNNLRPLAHDTISFGSVDRKLGQKLGITKSEAEAIHKEADESKNYLEYQLSNIFWDMVKSAPSDNKPIEAITYRIKTPNSIKEKSESERLLTTDEVKSNMTDIIGARIILDDTTVESVDKVLYKIAEAEANNKLRILEIENYRPEPDIDDYGNILQSYDYSSPFALRVLKNECAKKGEMIHKRDEDVPVGYMAIHLLTELPNGFTGEIQIMGKEVDKLKHIEDLCYKAKRGKTVLPKYSPIADMVKPLTNRSDILLRKEYNNYTREAYIYQRKKEMGIVKDDKFLAIPNYLPKSLDFNTLSDKIKECDETERIKLANKNKQET